MRAIGENPFRLDSPRPTIRFRDWPRFGLHPNSGNRQERITLSSVSDKQLMWLSRRSYTGFPIEPAQSEFVLPI